MDRQRQLEVGPGKLVRGRPDASGAKLEAVYDLNMRMVQLTCAAKPDWYVLISKGSLAGGELTFMVNPGGFSVNVTGDTLRLDTDTDPCFWAEVDLRVWEEQ